MLFLFALLLTNFAGILVTQPNKQALIAFAATTVLGFYTIPIFLYPWTGISLWVVATYLFAKESWQEKSHKLAAFFGVCALSGLFTLILYSPVILFGSGLSSLISNEIVRPLTWSTFMENLDPRMLKAWNENLLSAGFLGSSLLYWKVSNQKLPMQIFLALGAAMIVLLQRVTPLPRIWLYLEVFYLMFAAAGLVWLVEFLFHRIANPLQVQKILSFRGRSAALYWRLCQCIDRSSTESGLSGSRPFAGSLRSRLPGNPLNTRRYNRSDRSR
jgi:hypothetical protein